ncbi:hypothetical protein [Leptospira mayottensis]|nr:hypothetical protein [Leptospira mayottensis]
MALENVKPTWTYTIIIEERAKEEIFSGIVIVCVHLSQDGTFWMDP